jgi:hypothetical protein
MAFFWSKAGLIFHAYKDEQFIDGYAMVPTLDQVSEKVYKLYFAFRNKQNQSFISFCIIDLETLKIIDTADSPILSPGDLGTFDDNGVLPSSIIEIDGYKYMYYIGFKPGGTTRMDLFGGLACFNKDGSLSRYSKAPIIERCKVNPYINTAPFVIKNHYNTSYQYFMYYVAGCGWINKDLPKYNIQIAFSNDGINWIREGKVCIDFKDENEVALARPYVLFDRGQYHMWFSYKGSAYRIGYASSNDGIEWIRRDEDGGMMESQEKNMFDSDMVAYSCVVPYKDKYYMFYNGNNYGHAGIGLAVAHV